MSFYFLIYIKQSPLDYWIADKNCDLHEDVEISREPHISCIGNAIENQEKNENWMKKKEYHFK